MSKNTPSKPMTYELGFADQMQRAGNSLFRSWYDRTCLLADVVPAPKPSAKPPAQPDAIEFPYRLAS